MALNPRVFIISGEASGDLHGAHLIHLLQPSLIQFYAMGGKGLKAAGAKIIVDSTPLAVVGFVEVISKLNLIKKTFKKILAAIKTLEPQLIILIDYPGFNLRLAKAIKNSNPNIKILYYISPQLWAWRYNRIYHIKKYIDLMAVIFPFEVAIYQQQKIPVKFVGNPLVTQVTANASPSESRLAMGVTAQTKLIGLMPGSRKGELTRLLPVMLKAAENLQKIFPNSHFVLPLAPTLTAKDLQPFLKQTALSITICQSHYNMMASCDALIVASGTATLEVALLKRPMVIIYKLSPLTYFLGKLLIHTPHVGLCNIIAEERIVTELIQQDANPDRIANEVCRLLLDRNYVEQMTKKFIQLIQKLQEQTATQSLSDIVRDMVQI